MNGNLDSFITKGASPQPEPIATSQEIRDRGSIFVANIYQATTPEEAKARVTNLKHIVHRSKPATHEIAAWRCMVLKHGHTGFSGPNDFELRTGSMDDGESWAGGKVLNVMQNQAVIDAVVIVSRWYGGIMLGPARFAHIETCAAEVCREFKRKEDLRESLTTLGILDDMLADLRDELSQLGESPSTSAISISALSRKKVDYSMLDITKAKRLIRARENAIKSVKSIIAKKSQPAKENSS